MIAQLVSVKDLESFGRWFGPIMVHYHQKGKHHFPQKIQLNLWMLKI